MKLKSILLSLLAPAAALVAVPAMAQAPGSPAAPEANLPTCSAKVTGHCVQRSGGHMAAHHKMGKHHAKARRHHKAMKHHTAAKPVSAKPAKPKR